MAIEDWYAILEVAETATEKEIKRAYRKMAGRYHPDKNAAADASEQFQRVTRAYQVLSDKAQRQHFDWLLEQKRGTVDSSGQARQQRNQQAHQQGNDQARRRARTAARQRRYAQETAHQAAAQSERAQRRHEPFLQAVEEQVAREAKAYREATRKRALGVKVGLALVGALLMLTYAAMRWG